MFVLETTLRQPRHVLAICLAALIAACSQSAVEKIDGDKAFVGVSVVDVAAGETRPAQTVVITGDRISAILPAADVVLADGVEIVDGTGRYLAPGMMDMHTHSAAPDDLVVALGHGVTTIRIMWGNPPAIDLRQKVQAGEIPGPRIYLAGDLVDGDPPIWADMGLEANSYTDPDAMDEFVAQQKAAGFDFVKTYSRLSPEVFDAILTAGRKHDMEISGHVPQAVPLQDAIGGGMKTSEHFIGVLASVLREDNFPNPDVSPFFPDAKEFVEKIGRGEIDAADVVDPEKLSAVATYVAANDHWLVPTHDIMRNFTQEFQRPDSEVLKYMSPQEQAIFQFIEDGSFFKLTPEQRTGESALYAVRTEVLKAFYDAGAKILAGTDHGRMVGWALVEELMAFEKAGFSRAAALRAATSEPANYLGRAGDLGVVVEGAVADLLLLQADPLEDLGALRQIDGVMQNGDWHDRSKLDAMLDDVVARAAATED